MRYKIPKGTTISRRDWRKATAPNAGPWDGWEPFVTTKEAILGNGDLSTKNQFKDEIYYYYFYVNDPKYDMIAVEKALVEKIDEV